MSPTADRVNELLEYNPDTGVFKWRVDRGGLAKAATKAGRPSTSGHIEISVDGQRYRAHRLAWLICYGHWPDGPLDHANGVPADNRIANLRFASPSQNSANTRVRCNSQTGVKNVVKHNNRFEARIRSNGKVHYLGLYKTLDEAAAVVRAKHAELFGEYTPDRERAGW
jgi:hypothetical protein